MKIIKIHIIGFGKFFNFDLNFDKDFQFIYGANEAGKSTIRQFIFGVLFGFSQKKGQGQNLYEPLSKAQYGGSVTIEKNQHSYTITRLKRTQSVLSISNDSGQKLPHPEEILKDILRPFDKESFLNIFSFDSEQLNEIKTLSGIDLSNRLLSFSAVSANHWQNRAKELDKASSEQFGLTKTAKRPINLLLKKHAEINDQLKEMSGGLLDYKNAIADKKRVLADIYQIKQQVQDNNKKINEYQSLVDLDGLVQRKKSLADSNGDSQFDLQQISALTDDDERRIESFQAQIKSLSSEEHDIEAPTRSQQSKLLQIYQKNQDDLDLLDKSIPNLIAQSNLYDQFDNQINQVSDQIAVLERDIKNTFQGSLLQPLPQEIFQSNKRHFSPFFFFGCFLILGGLLAAFGSFMNREMPYPFLISSVGALIIGSILVFLEKPKKEYPDLAEFGYPADTNIQLAASWQRQINDYHNSLARLSSLKDNRQDNADKINRLLKLAYPLKDFLPEPSNDHDQFINQIQVVLNRIKNEKRADDLSREQRKLVDQNEREKLNKLEKVQNEQKIIFAKIGVQNYQEFQYLQADKFKKRQRENQLSNISQLLTPQKEAQIRSLGGIEAIKNSIVDLKRKQADLDHQINDLNKELANRDAKLINADSDESYQDLLQERADLETEINQSLFQYFSGQLAARWINQSLYDISHERIPQIKSFAQKYFSILTDGKYQKIIFNDNSIGVVEDDGKRFFAYELSKGTAEQLYIALRLAFAKSIAAANPLPFLIDDGFVDFDKHRRNIMVSILKDLSKNYQIIYFSANQEQSFDERNIIELKGVDSDAVRP